MEQNAVFRLWSAPIQTFQGENGIRNEICRQHDLAYVSVCLTFKSLILRIPSMRLCIMQHVSRREIISWQHHSWQTENENEQTGCAMTVGLCALTEPFVHGNILFTA